MKRILWLASWYPNEAEPFSGDFIQRQAKAVSAFQPITVIYVGKSAPGRKKKKEPDEKTITGNLQENIVYYSTHGFLSKWKSLVTYFKKHHQFITELKRKNELPDLVHAHVAMKAGLIALYLKWRYNIPYVVTEHWTGYYRQAKDSLFRKSFISRYMTRLILRQATRLIPVSEALGNQINQYWAHVRFEKIPNVVNTKLFYPSTAEPVKPFRFIHVSALVHQKNPEGIVRTFVELTKHGFNAELILIGPATRGLRNQIANYNLPENKIQCLGEISYAEVGIEFRKSSALVLFSFYENMPCVILEALCTGVPVIATRVGGISEVVREENGILVTAGNENELLEAMKEMIRSHLVYDRDKIASQASSLFSYETIGKKITDMYDTVLKKD
jgi:glycosyltransferase involved in cell wall biosynthesis